MEILNELSANKNVCLALGFFDGVHFAHQKLLEETVFLAKKNNIKSAVLTFVHSPFSIINNVPPVYITNFEKKAELIEKIGIDYLYAIDFNKIKDLKAKNYIEEILLKFFAPKYVVTGFNHTFGKFGKGNVQLLSSIKEFEHIMISPVKIENTIVSSTNVRKFIQEGDFYFADELLKRPFSVKGKVVKGAQIARTLGKKTANIIWDKTIVKPPYGVYFGSAVFDNNKYPALINFGIRPTIDKDLKETLEAHIIGFEGDIYDKIIEIEFYKKLRTEKKFNSKEELKNQIEADFAEAVLISKFYF